MTVFSYLASYGAQATRKPAVNVAKFGDGYEQRIQDGINAIPEIWSLTFANRQTSEAQAIDAFLTAAAGVTNFTWTTPLGITGKFVCRTWQPTIGQGNIWSVTATFEQVFE